MATRLAHMLFVPTLAVGLGLGPVASARAAMAAGVEPTAESDSGSASDAVDDSSADGSAPKSGDATTDIPEAAVDGPATADSEPGDSPSESGEAASDPPGTSPEDPGSDAGPSGAESSEPESEEPTPASTDAADGVITVSPGPVTSLTPAGKPTGDGVRREVVEDPRRRRSDERILFRAGLLSLGVAGLALVPMGVGLHQRGRAQQVIDRLETPSEQDARAQVEGYEQSMTNLAIIGGAVAAGGLVAGAVLIGIGLRRSPPGQQAVAPAIGPGMAGVVFRRRF